ncbi:fungal-specific transcription factor domain-containing protein [Chaetomium tenue]|uniref:Fungal-specific transcription factor domain-containing protein n=1 Tax=Chaetomium tenue TaxID=1854479 RepID=A0ACB7PA34_9PEZI|nr:fungal-specific transcription factor domain-containing protein [Chaetomium globosum]
MKNRQKSRSGCRTCKVRRLRCDETKPGCQNCAHKGFDCPGYQQRLQWSTKHERPTTTNTSGPANFTQLVTAASVSIASTPTATTPESSAHDGTRTSLTVPVPARRLGLPVVPSLTVSTSGSLSTSASPPSSSSSPSSSTPSPPTHYQDLAANVESYASLIPALSPQTGPMVPKGEPGSPDDPDQARDLAMYQPVVDIPTFLIEHWFKSVCSSWSALDSPTNPYRQLTGNLWRTSSSVFYALQAISAASLVERLPHVMKDTARSAPRNAFQAIGKELEVFHNNPRPAFPTELLLSLFCMSSSMCWLEARQLGQQSVREARRVLKRMNSQVLDSGSQEQLDFFNGCLVYEEMLRSVVSDDEIDFKHMLSWPEPTTQRPLLPTVSHPWTGVPSDILRLFGKAIALCRRSRNRWRLNNGTSYRILEGAMKDIQAATKVEESLLSVIVPPPPECPQPPQTFDSAQTLYYLSEAYRLCALLQLYETFPDLSIKRNPNLEAASVSVIWQSWATPQVLHVVNNVLGKVPAGSLSCIQPLLCLCAGSGLRYEDNSKIPLRSGNHKHPPNTDFNTAATPVSGAAAPGFPLPGPGISENAIKISQARLLIMNRLDQLEICLPPKPIGVAKQLVRAVWTDNALDRRAKYHLAGPDPHTAK